MTQYFSSNPLKKKNISDHLKNTDKRKLAATSETHRQELPGHISAGIRAAKETAFVFLIIWSILPNPTISVFFCIGCGYTIWKTGQNALFGWNRLEKLHRIIEEKRFEIDHHRSQKKQELRKIYASKGLFGKLLDEVVDFLLADDNRLLLVMLKEELGLTLESYEHPLKQAFGAFIGAFTVSLILIGSIAFGSQIGLPLFTLLLIIITSNVVARYEKRNQLNAVVWNGSLTLFIFGVTYFITRLLK